MKYNRNIILLDKFNYNVLVILICALLLSNIIQLNFANAAPNNELEWSFVDNPYPFEHMLTDKERAAVQLPSEENDFAKFCERLVQAHFKIYSDRYPQFAESGPEDKRFVAWKRHIIEDGYTFESYCIDLQPFFGLLEAQHQVNLIFCGVFSGKPATTHERVFVHAVEKLIADADAGNFRAMHQLMNLHTPESSLSLNPDVELYIRKLLQSNDEYKKEWHTCHLEPLLTPERIEFVNTAVERGDFAAVLETTAPCPVR